MKEKDKIKELQALSNYRMLKDDESEHDVDDLSQDEGDGKIDQYFKDLQKIKERTKQ